jgi:hypothetical protein
MFAVSFRRYPQRLVFLAAALLLLVGYFALRPAPELASPPPPSRLAASYEPPAASTTATTRGISVHPPSVSPLTTILSGADQGERIRKLDTYLSTQTPGALAELLPALDVFFDDNAHVVEATVFLRWWARFDAAGAMRYAAADWSAVRSGAQHLAASTVLEE